MGWLQTAWQLIRDIALTGAGLYLLISQDWSARPDAGVIVAGVTLVGAAAAPHAVSVLSGPQAPSGHGGPPSSSPPASPPSSSPSPGVPGEAR